MPRPIVAFETDASAAPGQPPAWLAPLAFAAVAVQTAIFLGLTVAGAVLKPYSDAYSFIYDAWRWRDGAQGLPAYLWAPHIGHHTVWVRLLFALETAVVGSAWPTIAACTLCLLLSALLLWLAASDPRLTSLRFASPAACAMLMLTGFNALDADQPINALYPFCIVFVLASLILFQPPQGGSAGPLRRTAALLCAMGAAFGNGAALALWPALALLSVMDGGRRWLWTGIVLAVGAVFGGLYVSGAGELADLAAAGGGADAGVSHRIVYLLDYITLPWSQVSAVAGAVMGVASLALCGVGARLAWARGLAETDRLALGMIAFSLVTAVLAAAGRGGFAAELRAPMRYAVFAAPLQAGLVMLFAPEAQARLAGRRALAAPAAAVVLVLLLTQQAFGAVFVLKSADRIRATIADYERGVTTPLTPQLVYPDLVFAGAVEARLKRERVFGKAPQELASPAASAGGRTP